MKVKMSPADAAFLMGESKECPQHAGALMTFSLPDDAPAGFLSDGYRKMRSFPVDREPFNFRLVDKRFSKLRPEMEVLPSKYVDLDYHFRMSCLPHPGGELELGILISRLFSIPMDLSRPLWEIHLIEGLEGNRFAIFIKLHHALTDGGGGIQLANAWLSSDPRKKEFHPIWSSRSNGKNDISWDFGQSRKKSRKSLLRRMSYSLGSTRQALTKVMSAVNSSKDKADEGGLIPPCSAPSTILNSRITPRRRVSTEELPFDRVKALSKRAGVTINDVLLSCVGGALRRYLMERNELPENSLVAGNLVNLRGKDEQDQVGNHIAFMAASLASDEPDPVQRLKKVNRSTVEGKNEYDDMSLGAKKIYSSFLNLPVMLSVLTRRTDVVPNSFNLLVSNLPGFKQQMYFGGCPLRVVHPISVITHGLSLLICFISCHDKIGLNIVACPDVLPGVQSVALYIPEEFEQLEAMIPAEETDNVSV